MAKDFVFRIKPGDPLPPIAPGGYRFMLDESTGAIKLLTSDGRVVDPTSSALVPTITNLQPGDFLYSPNGIDFQNTAFIPTTLDIINQQFGFHEYTYVEQTILESAEILDLSGKTFSLSTQTPDRDTYMDVERIICELKVKTPLLIETAFPDLALEFTGQATGAIGNIDLSFLTSTENAYVVQYANKTSTGGTLSNTSLTGDSFLEIGLNHLNAIITGDAEMKVTIFYKIRTFGNEYK